MKVGPVMSAVRWCNLHRMVCRDTNSYGYLSFKSPGKYEELKHTLDMHMASVIAEYLTRADWQNWNFLGLCETIGILSSLDLQLTLEMFRSIDVEAVIDHLEYLVVITKDEQARDFLVDAIEEWDTYIRVVILALKEHINCFHKSWKSYPYNDHIKESHYEYILFCFHRHYTKNTA